MASQDFASKGFVVTGGGGDIGIATIRLLLARGARVAVLDRSLDACRGQSDLSSNANLAVSICDVTSEEEVAAAMSSARRFLGAIDGIVNAAGIEGKRSPIDECPVEMFEAVMAVNVTGVFLCMKHVIPHLRANGGGVIVNVCSTAGFKGVQGMAPYVASKHAVLGLTRSGALEWGRYNIRINCVAPGPVEGRMLSAIYAEKSNDPSWPSLESRKALNPSGRFAQPVEVAATIGFLLSDASLFVNGAIFSVDGGVSAL